MFRLAMNQRYANTTVFSTQQPSPAYACLLVCIEFFPLAHKTGTTLRSSSHQSKNNLPIPQTDQPEVYTTAVRKPLRRKCDVISVRSRGAKSSKEVRLISAYHKAVHIITLAVDYVPCVVL